MWPFTKKKLAQADLVFKNSRAFFEYWCKFGSTEIQANTPLLAIVVDAAKEYGTREPVQRRPDGIQNAALRVASSDGGFNIMPSLTATANGDPLQPGDLVMWVPMAWHEKLADEFGDARQGWIGLIVAKVAPILTATGSFTILSRFD